MCLQRHADLNHAESRRQSDVFYSHGAESGGSPNSYSLPAGLSIGFYGPPVRFDGHRTWEPTSGGAQFRHQSDVESSVSEGVKFHESSLGRISLRHLQPHESTLPSQTVRKPETSVLHIGAPAFSPPNTNNELDRPSPRFQYSYNARNHYGHPDSGSYATFQVRACL